MRRNSINSCNTVPVSNNKANSFKSLRLPSNSSQVSSKSMTQPILTNVNQPMSEIKPNKVKRLSWKISPRIPRFSRSSSSPPQIRSTVKKSSSFVGNDNFVTSEPGTLNIISSSPSTIMAGLSPQNGPSPRHIVWESNVPDANRSSNEVQDAACISEDGESIIRNEYSKYTITTTTLEENKENCSANIGHDQLSDSTPGRKNDGISNLGNTSASTAKTQKKNVKSKTIPRSFWRFIGKKHQPPALVTTPSLSPPSLSQFSYTSPPPTVSDRHPKKKKGPHPKIGGFSYTKQNLVNTLLRRSRNRTSSDNSILEDIEAPTLTYTSFPDPDPEDFINIYSWDLPDSITATEDAGGVLQMVEFDGIYVNGLRVI